MVGEWIASVEDQIVIRDPLPKKHTLSVVPSFQWSVVDRAFVDFFYTDKANDLDRNNLLSSTLIKMPPRPLWLIYKIRPPGKLLIR